MLISCGLLLYRRRAGNLEVLLAHPGGPYFANRDAGIWGIPKGLVEAGEDRLLAARREFEEEIGLAPPTDGPFLPLGPIKQKGGKIVYAWAAEADFEPGALKSNTFKMQWPPRSGQWIQCPEIDRAEWFSLAEAQEKILAAQWALVEELVKVLGDEYFGQLTL